MAERLCNGLQIHSLRLDPDTGLESLYGSRDYNNALGVFVSESRNPLKIGKNRSLVEQTKEKVKIGIYRRQKYEFKKVKV